MILERVRVVTIKDDAFHTAQKVMSGDSAVCGWRFSLSFVGDYESLPITNLSRHPAEGRLF